MAATATSSPTRFGRSPASSPRPKPHVTHAYEQGSITTSHVRLLGECLHERFDGAFARFEEELVGHATSLRFDEFQRLVGAWKDWADETSSETRERRDERAREVHLSRSFNDRGILKGTLTPVARSIVDGELRRLERVLFEQDWAEAEDRLGAGAVGRDDLRRSPAQRRHDALVWMAMRSSALDRDSGVAEPETVIHVHTTAADLEEALAHDAGVTTDRVRFDQSRRELEDGTPISRSKLVRMLIRAKVKRLVYGPRGEVIDRGRSARFFSAVQRDTIAARDRVCWCGCGLSARLCEMDHVIEWRDGGETDIANGRPSCRRSHRSKTNQRNRIQRE